MRRQPNDDYQGVTTLGIDVSKWQGDIRWVKVPDLVHFAIIRTGDGRDRDGKFDKNWKGAGQRGLIRGSYHYLRADRDGKAQAALAHKLITDAGGLRSTDLPPAVDLEGGAFKNLPGGLLGGTADLPVEMVAEETLEFLEETEKLFGVLPLIYSGQTFHWKLSQRRPDLAEEFAKYPFWLASINTPEPWMPVDQEGNLFPWDKWTFYQFSSTGQVDGIPGNVDMNYFRGDREELEAFISSLRAMGGLDNLPNANTEIVSESLTLIKRLEVLLKKLL
jgi:lysozyme